MKDNPNDEGMAGKVVAGDVPGTITVRRVRVPIKLKANITSSDCNASLTSLYQSFKPARPKPTLIKAIACCHARSSLGVSASLLYLEPTPPPQGYHHSSRDCQHGFF